MCYARKCRQHWILEYFGEADAGTCGNCDFCRERSAGDFRKPTVEEETVVKKALAGVARMSRRAAGGWEGIYGKGKIIQMLTGSKSQEILNTRLDRLTTYGILADKSAGYLNGLFRSMAEEGLVITQTGDYPLMTLTEKGEAVMLGKASFELRWPDEVAKPQGLEEKGFDPQLFTMLKDLRFRIAKKDGVPPYIVFSNKVLEALVRYMPTSIQEGLAIPGICEGKAHNYLPPFLEMIRTYRAMS